MHIKISYTIYPRPGHINHNTFHHPVINTTSSHDSHPDPRRTPIFPPQSIPTHPTYILPLFHSLTGAASCLPTTQPASPTSLSQHDHWNPLAKSSYSISVHASPRTSGSKSSQTGWVLLTSRLPVRDGWVSIGFLPPNTEKEGA